MSEPSSCIFTACFVPILQSACRSATTKNAEYEQQLFFSTKRQKSKLVSTRVSTEFGAVQDIIVTDCAHVSRVTKTPHLTDATTNGTGDGQLIHYINITNRKIQLSVCDINVGCISKKRQLIVQRGRKSAVHYPCSML